jgi:hypothetical protein
MPLNSKRFPPPVIAQIISPSNILYALHVFASNGYIVTRRRRGIGPPLPVFEFDSDTEPSRIKYAAYQDYFHPIFNESALARSEVKRETIETWLAVAGNDALTHPDYAPLCLRWGENPGGLFVEEYIIPAGNPDNQKEFIPYSCWQSGLTYYRFSAPYDGGSRYEKELKAQGVLREHTEEVGSEGDWYGWYTTDLVALQGALAVYGLTPVLAQVVTAYWVELKKSEHKREWIDHFYLESEALARYAQFRENPAYDAFRTNEYPRLIKGASCSMRDAAIDGWCSGEKVLLSCLPTEAV